MKELHSRPYKVEGFTYKIKSPHFEAAFYITINNIEVDGGVRPIEIFINTNNAEQHQWIIALARIISALFRLPGDYTYIFPELEQVFDPKGGYFDKQAMIPSVVAHIGKVLKEHCEETCVSLD